MQFKSVNEILDFAIRKEEEASNLYLELAGKAKQPGMQEVLKGFAAEEQGHKAKLLSVKQGQKLLSSQQAVMDLKIGDTLMDVAINAEMDYQDILILAMKAEKEAFKLYSGLAKAAGDAGIRDLFLGLAQEEAKHKLRFEVEYDDRVLTEN